MGLLDNLRKRPSEDPGDDQGGTIDPAAEPLAGLPDDDPWLAAVDRRRPDGGEPPTSHVETPIGEARERGPLLGSEVPVIATDSAERLPDLGMVYAGLSTEGIAPLPVEDHSNEHGPSSPEAADHLAVLGLSMGASWLEIANVRRRLLAENPPFGTAEQLQRRMEVNHASAALRLLYAV